VSGDDVLEDHNAAEDTTTAIALVNRFRRLHREVLAPKEYASDAEKQVLQQILEA
jgi:hypothetical protein